MSSNMGDDAMKFCVVLTDQTKQIVFISLLVLGSLLGNGTIGIVISASSLIWALISKMDVLKALIAAVPFSVLISFRITTMLSFSDIVLPIALVAAFLKLRRQQISVQKVMCLPAIYVAAITLVVAISMIGNALSLGAFLVPYVKLIFAICYGILAMAVVIGNFANLEYLQDLLKTWVLTAAILGGVGFLTYVAFSFGITSGFMYGMTEFRLQGPFENPNAYAAYGVISLGLGIYFSLWAQRNVLSTINLLILIGIVLTSSRAGEIATIVLFVGLLICSLMLRNQFVKTWLPFIVVGIFVIFLLVPISEWAVSALKSLIPIPQTSAHNIGTFLPTQARENVTSDSRIPVWEIAIELWRTRPFQGIGLGQFIERSAEYFKTPILVHNTFLSFLTETGVLGFLVVITPFAYALYKTVWLRSMRGFVLFCTLLSFAVMMFANNMESSRSYWLLIGAITGASLISKSSSRFPNKIV